MRIDDDGRELRRLESELHALGIPRNYMLQLEYGCLTIEPSLVTAEQADALARMLVR